MNSSEDLNGYVSYLSNPADLAQLVAAAADGTRATWTVCEHARADDLVLFYYTEPVSAFIAYGRVLARSAETWGDDRKPMADVGEVRFLPVPVPLRSAKEALGMAWLNAASGFGRRQHGGVGRIIVLGGGHPQRAGAGAT